MSDTACTVLVIDDEPHVLSAIARLDFGPGIRLLPCPGLAEAERLLEDGEAEVALVDEHLGPGQGSGLDFLERLQRQDPDCFRIIFTGDADLDFAVGAINRGLIDAFLCKPWINEQVVALVHQGIETALLRRHNRALLSELAQRNLDLLTFNANLERIVEERTSHLREAHERLHHQQEALIRLETHSVVNFLARGMAHELNNPLAAIMGYAQRLRRTSAEPDTQRRLDIILAEVERCRQLVEQLRRMAAPLGEDVCACKPDQLLQGVVTKLEARSGRAPALQVEGRIPQVEAGPRALERVLAEVVENAILSGATRMTLSATERHGRIRLALANDGSTPGAEEAANAVKPFFTTRADRGHRGLGLSLAAGMLRDQDGHLELHPAEDGKGAVCVIQLPPARTPMVQRSSARLPVAPPDRVLVVDDEQLVAEVLVEQISGPEVQAVAAGSVAEALGRLEEGRWLAMITDLHLPDGTGIQLAEQAVALHPELVGRVALVTGGEVAEDGCLAGLPVLRKPFRTEEVKTLVGRLARKP